MSKERAQRRAEREREAAVLAAARAAEAERRERRDARLRAMTSRLPRRRRGPSGILAERRRTQGRVLVLAGVVLNALVWFATDDWYLRSLALLLTVLLLPLVHVLMTRK
ncbi:hypothetical protein [Nocardioides aquiterrae]|uniref:DUF3040 domain-containing protein n=1 Tax=Nocardioides aquiterrae TaxID=203799 RepID=A0ABN1UEP6_9ACTN